MNSNGKKISFGFSKLSKKPNVINPDKEKESVELIDCLEGAEIRVKNAIKKVEKSPLVIPIKGGANNIVHQIEHGSLKNKKKGKDIIDEDLRPDSELTIEELAARQLLREARQKLEHNKDTTKVHVLPLEGNKTIQDAVEPSMDDYENVPIGDFGLACLRGMGWKEGDSIGKNPSKFVKPAEPDLRPKGLGLGAQKIIDFQAKDVFDGNGKKLVLAKGSFGKIVAGSHKGKFCEIQFCHEWSGRVDVKLSNSNEILTLPELLVTPVSKDDYIRGSKVINNAKFEQYKQMQENEGFSNRKMIVEEMKHSRSSSRNKDSQNGSQMKQEPESRKQESSGRNHFAIKQEFKKDIPLDKAASSDDEKYKSKDATDPRYRKESKSNHRRRGSRNKYSEMNDSKQNKYDGESSEENSSRSRSTDSSNRYYDKSKSNPKNTEYEEIKIKSRHEGVESGSSHSRKKSKTRRRNRSRSSSEGYNDSMEKRNISKGERKDYRKYPNEKVKNEKNDYDREKSKKYAKSRDRGEGTYEEKHKKKSKKYRKDRESSSE